MNDSQRITADAVLAVWKRRRGLALLLFVLVCAGAVAVILSLPPLYRATATVLVERQQISEAMVRPVVTTELETRIQTVHRQVTSRARLADVITRFGLYPDLRRVAPMESVVERMRRDIRFDLSGVPQTSGRTAMIAFTISYVGSDPFVVAEVTNTLVNSYIEEHTQGRERQAVRTAEFLKTQLEEARKELDEHERQGRTFTLQHTTELPQQVGANLAALDRLNTQLRLNGEYQLRAIERRERLEQARVTAQVAARESAPAADQSSERLQDLKRQLAALETKFSDRYPDVIRLKGEIAALEAQSDPARLTASGHDTAMREAARRASEQGLKELDAELAHLKQEEGQLRRLLDEYDARVANAPRRQEELERLTRDTETMKERYATLLKRYEDARVAESLEQGKDVEGFRVLDAAVPPTGPAAPNRLWLLMLSVAGSLGCAIVAIVAAEKLDTTFHGPEELRAFATVPTVAVIRQIAAPRAVERGRMRLALETVAILVALATVIGVGRYVGTDNEQLVRMTERGRE